jgi:hypothetical protein
MALVKGYSCKNYFPRLYVRFIEKSIGNFFKIRVFSSG